MIPNPSHDISPRSPAEMPNPGRGARWRWSTPRDAVAGGGLLAAVLALTTATTGAAVGAHTQNGSPSGEAGATPPRGIRPGNGRPAVVRRITSTVVFSESISLEVVSKKSGNATASSRSASKVGQFVAAQGTRRRNEVRASAVLVGGVPPPATPPRGRRTLRSG
jgi:hypothetical protein